MIVVDGGTGGGQLVRLAVALAVVDHTSVTIENVRGNRPETGLKPQHVASIEAVRKISDATTDGVTEGSETVRFDPGSHIGGTTAVDIGTAGSISLLFDAILPLAVVATGPITIRATGGTDVKWAPPLDYFRDVKRPMLEEVGVHVEISELKRGFYPSGGGHATLTVSPATPESLLWSQRGDLKSVTVKSVETADLADADVADRQINGVKSEFKYGVSVPMRTASTTVDRVATGTVITIEAAYEYTRAGFSALGEPGRPAETVGRAAAKRFLDFQAQSGAVDSHMADQLLPFLALAGGSFTTPKVTDHIRSATALLETFGYDLEITTEGSRVRIRKR